MFQRSCLLVAIVTETLGLLISLQRDRRDELAVLLFEGLGMLGGLLPQRCVLLHPADS